MDNIPTNEYKPLSAWGYIGYQLLFAIPIVGFILLIVFSFDNSYIARRNYARSFFCIIILAIIAFVFFSSIIMSVLSSILM